jgi:hypothetical protein
MTYGHPVSNRTIDSIVDGLELDEVLELTRLVCLDGYGKNLESYVISQSFRWLKTHAKEVKVLVSYADPEQGHQGTIYKAANFKFEGMTALGSSLLVDGKPFHIRTLSMLDRPYGVEINELYKAKDPGIQIVKTKAKYIYTYQL